MQIHGWSWLWRPGVLIIATLIVIPFLWMGLQWLLARRAAAADSRVGGPTDEDAEADAPGAHPRVALILAALATAAFAYAAVEMTQFNPSSRLMPLLCVVPGLPLSAWLLLRGVRELGPKGADLSGEPQVLLVLLGYAVAVWAAGYSLPTAALVAWMLLVRARMRWWTAALYGVLVFALVRLLFELLRGDPPTGALLPLS